MSQIDYEATTAHEPDTRGITAGLRFVGYGLLFVGGAILTGAGAIAESINSNGNGIFVILGGVATCVIVSLILFIGELLRR